MNAKIHFENAVNACHCVVDRSQSQRLRATEIRRVFACDGDREAEISQVAIVSVWSCRAGFEILMRRLDQAAFETVKRRGFVRFAVNDISAQVGCVWLNENSRFVGIDLHGLKPQRRYAEIDYFGGVFNPLPDIRFYFGIACC